jgi:hypothetical protein
MNYADKSSSGSKASGGLGFVSALQIAFIVLKLCKVINWSWLLVLSPTWISTILGIIIFAVIWKILK